MSSCDNSNIKKNYIVTSTEIDILSACTGFYTNDIYPCTGDTIIVHSDILSANTINSSVILSGGTNLLDIFGSMDTNTFVTGFTYDNSNNLTISRNDAISFDVNITEFSGITVNGVLSACTGIYTSNIYGCSPITVQDDLILLSGLTLSAITNDDSLSEILVRDSVTGLVKYRDVSSITPDTNTFVTGVTYTKDYAVLTRNDNVDVLKLSGGTNVTFNNPSPNEIVIDVTIPPDTNTFVSGFTYDDSNNLTISRNDDVDFGVNIDTMSGLTINGDLLVTGTTNISGLTSINSSLDVYNGTIGLRDNDYFLQGTSTGGTNVQLIGVYSNNEILIGNQGYTNRIMDDTIIKGGLDILSGLTLSQTPTLNNSGTDILIRNNVTGEVEYRPVSGITPDTNTFVTGFTYDNVNTFTISRNDDVDLTSTISILSGITYYGDGSNLSGITTTDTFVTGGTYDNVTDIITFTNNSGGTFDVTGITDNFVIAGSYSDSTDTISLLRQDGSFVNITGVTDNFVSGGTYNSGTNEINFVGNSSETTFDVDLSSLISSVSGDTFVVSGNADVATSQLTFTYNTGGTFTVTNSAALFADNDINVTGGTYDNNTGCVTFTTNSGTSFDVCGFVTGLTDTFTTGSTLVGETIQFDSNILGPNYYNVSLSPVLSGKTDNSTFNSYTSNTETILNSKVSGATNLSTTGLFAQKNGDNLEFKGLTSTGGTVEITNDSTTVNLEVVGGTDTFSTGGTVTQSATSGSSDVIVQIVGNDGFTPYNITGLTDTFINDFSISSNTFTISQNDGSSFVATADTIDLASVLSAVTFDIGTSGSISATTFNGGTFNGTFVGDGSGLTGITDNNTFVTGGTFNNNTDTITFTNNSGGTFTVTGITDNFVSGGTYNVGTQNIDFSGNSVDTTFSVDLTALVNNVTGDTFVTGTTFASNQAVVGRNDGFDVLSLSGTNDVTLTNPSSNQIVIDVNGLKYFISETNPTGVTLSNGYRWFNTSIGSEFVYIDDGDSSQWVQPLIQPGPQGPQGPSGNPYFITTGITTSAETLTTGFTYYGVSYVGDVDLTLPDPTGIDGFNFTVKDEGGNAGTYRIRLIPSVGLIDGNTSVDMANNYMGLYLVARNNNWWII